MTNINAICDIPFGDFAVMDLRPVLMAAAHPSSSNPPVSPTPTNTTAASTSTGFLSPSANAAQTSGAPRCPRRCNKGISENLRPLSWDGGITWTTARSTTTLSTTEATYNLGSTYELWGCTWSSGNFSNTNFRLRVIDVAGNLNRDFFLDYVAVNVAYGP